MVKLAEVVLTGWILAGAVAAATLAILLAREAEFVMTDWRRQRRIRRLTRALEREARRNARGMSVS